MAAQSIRRHSVHDSSYALVDVSDAGGRIQLGWKHHDVQQV